MLLKNVMRRFTQQWLTSINPNQSVISEIPMCSHHLIYFKELIQNKLQKIHFLDLYFSTHKYTFFIKSNHNICIKSLLVIQKV